MTLLPALRWLTDPVDQFPCMEWHETTTCMGALSAGTMKPSAIAGNDKHMVLALTRRRPQDYERTTTDTVTAETRGDGSTSATGGAGLKGAQAYTPEFASVILLNYNHFSPLRPVLVGDDIIPCLPAADVWDTAALDEVLEFMKPRGD